MTNKARVVFMGSPDFAVPSLRNLNQYFNVVGVVTQPDKPAGRGMTLTPPPVKAAALEAGLPVIQPVSLKEEGALAQLREWAPDVIVVVAFGQLLRENVLTLPAHGCVNVHASLLPAYRGAAPIQAALLNGDKTTGVTIMKMDKGLDTGPILGVTVLPISADETGGTLFDKLAELGASSLTETLTKYLRGEITPRPQPEEGMSYFGMISKADGVLDVEMDVDKVERMVRAYSPWPGTTVTVLDSVFKIHKARIQAGNPKPGERTVVDGFPALGFKGGWLVLEKLQPAGKKAMDGKAFLAGNRGW